MGSTAIDKKQTGVDRNDKGEEMKLYALFSIIGEGSALEWLFASEQEAKDAQTALNNIGATYRIEIRDAPQTLVDLLAKLRHVLNWLNFMPLAHGAGMIDVESEIAELDKIIGTGKPSPNGEQPHNFVQPLKRYMWRLFYHDSGDTIGVFTSQEAFDRHIEKHHIDMSGRGGYAWDKYEVIE